MELSKRLPLLIPFGGGRSRRWSRSRTRRKERMKEKKKEEEGLMTT